MKLRSLLLFAGLFAGLPAAYAVQLSLRCSFDPPGDVVNEPGIEYAVEALRSNGTWVEVARGPAVPNTVTGEGSLKIEYPDNAPFGTYTVRVVVVKPMRGPESDTASTTVTPGKPTNPKIHSSR